MTTTRVLQCWKPLDFINEDSQQLDLLMNRTSHHNDTKPLSGNPQTCPATKKKTRPGVGHNFYFFLFHKHHEPSCASNDRLSPC